MKATVLLLIAVLSCSLLAFAQTGEEHKHPVPERLGTVSFPTSCAPAVQKKFERGVALLHSFAYEAAEQAFREVLQLDDKCAMAHWGMAMSYYHQLWEPWITPQDLKRGAAELEVARQLQSSERERGYIEALNAYYQNGEQRRPRDRALEYERGMAKVVQNNPGDSEAQVFYALALLATASPTDRSHANQKKAADILEPIERKQPQHPGTTHYLIHAYDNAELASRGVGEARKYSELAPSAPHALHMPSHIFTRLGMWSDSVRSNVEARKAAQEHGDIGEVFHAMDYLMYAYLQSGRVAEAGKLLQELRTLKGDANIFKIGYPVAAMPVRYAVEQGRWDEAARLEEMPQETLPQVRAIRLWARGIGLARTGKVDQAKQQVQGLQSARAELEKAGNSYWAAQVDVQIKEVQSLIALAEKKNEEALSLMRTAADQEDAAEKVPVTPGPIIPAREQLAGMLLEAKRPKEALAEYEASLALAPGRRASLTGAARAAEMAGESTKAKKMNAALRELN